MLLDFLTNCARVVAAGGESREEKRERSAESNSRLKKYHGTRSNLIFDKVVSSSGYSKPQMKMCDVPKYNVALLEHNTKEKFPYKGNGTPPFVPRPAILPYLSVLEKHHTQDNTHPTYCIAKRPSSARTTSSHVPTRPPLSPPPPPSLPT